MAGDETLLEVAELRTWFRRDGEEPVRAVDGVSFRVPRGGTVALVGESGSGKTVTALSLTRLLPEPPAYFAGGKILFEGRNVLEMSGRELRAIRGGKIAYVFQEPATALNPVLRVGFQVKEAVRAHNRGAKAGRAAIELLDRVGLPDPKARMRAYPHELSGGMQQRVVVAMALACRPALLVADEPTTALDVTIQAQILELLKTLQGELGMAVLLITHNLGLVAETADTVHVMRAGRIVESGPVEQVLTAPRDAYTKMLLAAVPRLEM